jgi:hypothetical protein
MFKSICSETIQKEFKKLVYFLIEMVLILIKQNDDGETPLHCFFNNKTINYLNQPIFKLKEKRKKKIYYKNLL